ncbi:unnamed protein product [Amoebophrya sp. A25]|nr:unnamed protein product [Amoebophrya sp. A25]|eukprot:GSA25T00014383001.1
MGMRSPANFLPPVSPTKILFRDRKMSIVFNSGLLPKKRSSMILPSNASTTSGGRGHSSTSGDSTPGLSDNIDTAPTTATKNEAGQTVALILDSWMLSYGGSARAWVSFWQLRRRTRRPPAQLLSQQDGPLGKKHDWPWRNECPSRGSEKVVC